MAREPRRALRVVWDEFRGYWLGADPLVVPRYLIFMDDEDAWEFRELLLRQVGITRVFGFFLYGRGSDFFYSKNACYCCCIFIQSVFTQTVKNAKTTTRI